MFQPNFYSFYSFYTSFISTAPEAKTIRPC